MYQIETKPPILGSEEDSAKLRYLLDYATTPGGDQLCFWMASATDLKMNPPTQYSFKWASGSTAYAKIHYLADSWIKGCLNIHKQTQSEPKREPESDTASRIRLWEPRAGSGQLLGTKQIRRSRQLYVRTIQV